MSKECLKAENLEDYFMFDSKNRQLDVYV